MSDIYRKSSLEKLNSLDELDMPLSIIRSQNYLTILAIFIILLSLITWSFLGEVSEKVAGDGILLKGNGIAVIQHVSSGKIKDIKISSGDFVTRGEIIARVEQPELIRKIRELKLRLEEEKQEKQEKINEKISELQEELDYKTNIISPYTGIVVELMVDKGAYINQGHRIAAIEPAGKNVKDIEAIVYVTASEGKKIKVGMDIQILPSTVKKEDYGYILGRVTYVSEYPASIQGMKKTLDNEEMVKNFSKKGPLLQVKADLIRTRKTKSGYKWTSKKGANMKIQSGTLCFAKILVDKKKPIELILPSFKR